MAVAAREVAARYTSVYFHSEEVARPDSKAPLSYKPQTCISGMFGDEKSLQRLWRGYEAGPLASLCFLKVYLCEGGEYSWV